MRGIAVAWFREACHFIIEGLIGKAQAMHILFIKKKPCNSRFIKCNKEMVIFYQNNVKSDGTVQPTRNVINELFNNETGAPLTVNIEMTTI
ncbi:MAG: hypothetical protein QF682_13605, partial [Candidatus Thermoplasmatota archaeon]|nr:hypothetical protein [Candidatus Thermoplasmatota archaeon]